MEVMELLDSELLDNSRYRQSPSALVERILETYLSLLQYTKDTQTPTIIGPLRAASDPSEGRQRA
jgi:hypothetical protein